MLFLQAFILICESQKERRKYSNLFKNRQLYLIDIFHLEFNSKYYILSQYTLKSMQLLCHCVYVSLLVYWIAYKLAYFTASNSQRFLQGQQFPSWFWRRFLCVFLVIVNRFLEKKKENFFIIQIKEKIKA